MAEEIVIKIDVQSGKAKDQIRDVKKSTDQLSESIDNEVKATDKLAKAKKELKFQLSEEGKELAGLKQSIKEATQLNKEASFSNLDLAKKVTSLTRAKSKLAALQSDEAIELAKVNEQIKIQSEINTNLAKSELGLANSKTKATLAAKRFRATSGLNNAILLETGRLASDASFGFTAIANNLSQVISLFSSYANNAGGFINAFKEIGRSLLGSGGVLIGIQLLISFLPKLIKRFTSASDSANRFKKSIDETTQSIKEQIGLYELLVNNLKAYGDIGNIAADANFLLAGSFNEFGSNLKKLEEGGTLRFTDIFGEEQALQGAEAVDALRERFFLLLEAREKEGVLAAKLKAKDAEGNLIIKEDSQERIRLQGQYMDAIRTRLKLQDEINVEEKKGTKDTADYQIKIFEAKYFDFEKIEQKYRERSKKSELMTNEEILAQTLQNEMAKIDIIEENFVRKEQVRLKNYKKQLDQDVKNEKISRATADKLAKEADNEYLKSLNDVAEKRKNLEVEVYNFINSLRTLQIRKDAENAEKEVDQVRRTQERLSEILVGYLKTGIGNDEVFYDRRNELLNQFLKRQNFIIKNAPEGSLIRVQAQMQAAKLEDQIRDNQLRKEIRAINERKRINNEYVNFAQGISSLLSNIAGENEALQNAALVVEKGAAIAGVVINAQQANATAVANEAKIPFVLPNPIPPFVPYPNPVKKPSMVATSTQIAKNNVSAGIAIANILATTLSSFSKPSGGTQASATTNVQAPSFNVVGPRTTDQLLGIINAGIGDSKVFVNVNEIDDGLNTIKKVDTTSSITG